MVLLALQTQPMNVIVQVIFQSVNMITDLFQRTQAHAIVGIATRQCKGRRGWLWSKETGACWIDRWQSDLAATTA